MRDTYADTTLARADLGFAPSVTLEEGLTADVPMVRSPDDDPAMTSGSRWRWLRVAWSRPAAAAPAQRAAVPPASAEADQFLFERGTAAFKERKWIAGARVLPADRRQLPAEHLPARRQAGRRRHLHRRALDRVAAAGRQRVPRVPDLLSDQPARRLRAVPAGDRPEPSRCWRPSATRPTRAKRQGAAGLRRAVSRTAPCCPRRSTLHARRPRTG